MFNYYYLSVPNLSKLYTVFTKLWYVLISGTIAVNIDVPDDPCKCLDS